MALKNMVDNIQDFKFKLIEWLHSEATKYRTEYHLAHRMKTKTEKKLKADTYEFIARKIGEM